jgi:predicted transcriptional regulator of viral defense system
MDATVRPVYSGGVAVVAKAFEEGRDRASVNKMAAYLRRLDYTYPYHQAVGFYLDRAGYAESQVALIRRFPRRLDFYLTHGMRATDYDEKWRLFIPKGF